MHRGVIDEKPVLGFAMLAQRLAVVACKHHESSVEKFQLAQAREESFKHGVIKSDFAVIQVAGVAAEVRLGRAIRAVRVVEMHP